jgi:hypothetical protein
MNKTTNNKLENYNMFNEVLNFFTLNEVCNKLHIHKGTITRWNKLKEVPDDYYNDLNKLLNFKYVKKISFQHQDQYFTKPEIAKYCYEKTISILKKDLKLDLREYTFIEPSAGEGIFYNLMPKNNKIGIDLVPQNSNIIEYDYLDYVPPKDKRYIVLGNPPFGLRGNLALRFINHSFLFADIVSFILPPFFNSNGKGNPKDRVDGYKLIHSENLPAKAFIYPNGNEVEVQTIFQIYSKLLPDLFKEEIKETCDEYIKVFSMSNGKNSSSQRNIKMIGKCDVYLPSTCFKGMNLYYNFDDLPNKRGYGVLFLKEKEKLKKIFEEINWESVAFFSTNKAMNLRMEKIKGIVIDNGFKDS